jgi:hypothetical protein
MFLERVQPAFVQQSSRGGFSRRGDPEQNQRFTPGLLRCAPNDGDSAFLENALVELLNLTFGYELAADGAQMSNSLHEPAGVE